MSDDPIEPQPDPLSADAVQAPTLQERFEASRVGRATISIGILTVLVSVVVWNLPTSAVKSELTPLVSPFVQTVGLDQNWSVFAPNPRRLTLDMSATIEFADGTSTRWLLPVPAEPLVTPYRTYRWQKWMEHARSDDNRGLWTRTARWLEARYSDQGVVVRVRLFRHWYDTPEPGTANERPEWQSFEYHTYEVSP